MTAYETYLRDALEIAYGTLSAVERGESFDAAEWHARMTKVEIALDIYSTHTLTEPTSNC
jgi:hypothetical protein